MGKYALLIAFAGILTVAVLGQQSQQTAQGTSANQGERQGAVIARQIARSAFSDGVSTVKRTFKSIDDGAEAGQYEQGDYRIEYTTTSGPGGGKQVDIVAEGTYRETTYQIQGTAVRDTSVSALFNGITANTPITFKVSGGGCSGGPCVSGLDGAGGEDRHGISLPPDGDPSAVCDEFNDSGSGDQIEGTGSGCDVITRAPEWDDWVTTEMGKMESEIQEAIDRGDGNVTTCDGCKLGNLSSSAGVLYVTGELRVNGKEQWDGLVYVGQGGSLRINGGGSVKNINGGLVMGDSTNMTQEEDIDLNGGNSINYNSQNLLDYVGSIPSIMTVTTTITDRRGRLIRTDE